MKSHAEYKDISLLYLAVISIIAALLADKVLAAEIKIDLDFSDVNFEDCEASDPAECRTWEPALGSLFREAHPIVPQRIVRVLIPRHQKFSGFRIETGLKRYATRRIATAPVQRPLTQDVKIDREIPHFQGDIFPSSWHSDPTLQLHYGYEIVHIAVYPMRYIAANEAVYLNRLTVIVNTDETDQKKASDGLLRHLSRDFSIVNGTVDNPSTIEKAGIVRPEDEIGYLIIGSRKILGEKNRLSLQELIDEKESKHINVYISYLEDISPEKRTSEIREHIKTQYKTNYIDYVLLVGDKHNLPWKYVKSGVRDRSDPVPSDQYYACLDGDFSSKSNIDWACEVSVGRIGVRSWEEARDWASKTIRLQDQIILDHSPKILNYGEKLDRKTLGSRSLEYVLNGTRKAPATNGFPGSAILDKLYDTFKDEKSYRQFVNMLNSGTYRAVNHLGHANHDYAFRMKAGLLREIKATPAFYYSQGCYPNDPDKDNWTIQAVRMPDYGPAAMISNTRYGWYAPGDEGEGTSSKLHRTFWAMGFEKGVKSIGRMNHEAKRIVVETDPSSLMVYTALESNLIGDPELNLAIK